MNMMRGVGSLLLLCFWRGLLLLSAFFPFLLLRLGFLRDDLDGCPLHLPPALPAVMPRDRRLLDDGAGDDEVGGAQALELGVRLDGLEQLLDLLRGVDGKTPGSDARLVRQAMVESPVGDGLLLRDDPRSE